MLNMKEVRVIFEIRICFLFVSPTLRAANHSFDVWETVYIYIPYDPCMEYSPPFGLSVW